MSVENHLVDMEPHLLRICREQRERIAELEASLEDLQHRAARLEESNEALTNQLRYLKETSR